MIELSSYKRTPEHKKEAGERISFLNRELHWFRPRMNDKRREKFYRELHTLLSAGVDLRTTFELLIEAAQKKEEKLLAEKILQNIIKGQTLPEAMQETGEFSGYEFYMLRIGEESGRMQALLRDLAQYYLKKIRQRRKVVSALTYPSIVVGVALVAVIFMLRFVVPMFADMLSRFGTELPTLTKVIISCSEGIADAGPVVLAALLGIVVMIRTQRNKEWFRKYTSVLLLRIPLLGRTVQKIYIERFSHAMHVMLSSKTNLLDALELVQKMIGFYPLERSLEQIRKDVFAGSSLHSAMSAFSIYPTRVTSLIRVAEEVNKVDDMFGKLSEQLSEEIEHETAQIGSVVEPVMILFLGLMVAVILVAMYLPMFELGSAFG